MVSLKESVEEKYGEKEHESEDFGFILFVSCSPEAKKGMFPPLITLNDFNIECFGDFSDFSSKIRHIRELDLTDNLLSDWSDVVNILNSFRGLTFLNLSNNLLSMPLDNDVQDNPNNIKLAMEKISISCNISKSLNLSQLVLNGNLVSWPAVVFLAEKMRRLEELHLSNNNLPDPAGIALQVRRRN